MSDEALVQPAFSDEACDECAPTERDPSRPARGVALSVLWWLERDDAERLRPVRHVNEDGSAT